MDKSDKPKQTQRIWIERGLKQEDAQKLESKIEGGALRGPAGERLLRALKANPELAKKYAEAKEMDPEKFVNQLVEEHKSGTPGIRWEELDKLKEDIKKINSFWNENTIKDYQNAVETYKKCILNFIYGRGTWEEINNSVLEMQPLAEKIQLLRQNIEPEILKCITELNSVCEILSTKSQNDEIVKKIQEDLNKLKDLANILGIKVDSSSSVLKNEIESWLSEDTYGSSIKDPLTYENILERLQIKEFGLAGSVESELLKTAKILTLLNTEIKGEYDIAGDKKELLSQINDQITILADNCLKVAIWKAIMDIFEAISESILKLFQSEEDELKFSREGEDEPVDFNRK